MSLEELAVVFVVALVVVGPERLPRLARQLGRGVNQARRVAGELRQQIEREVVEGGEPPERNGR